MAQTRKQKRRSFRRLENHLTKVIFLDLILFILALIAGGFGVGWLKILLAIVILPLSALGVAFLVLIGEHRRRRSLWMLTSFACIFLCMLVSLITNYPSPLVG